MKRAKEQKKEEQEMGLHGKLKEKGFKWNQPHM
jgi:hypothetical protein